jgi:DNA-binding winged helix-turn-helix (wHTH) protein
LHDKLWSQDTFVDFEHGLNKAINKVREVLGDSADNPRFVETLPRRGYRFLAPVVNHISADAAVENPSAEPQPWRRIGALGISRSGRYSDNRFGHRRRDSAAPTTRPAIYPTHAGWPE